MIIFSKGSKNNLEVNMSSKYRLGEISQLVHEHSSVNEKFLPRRKC